MQVIRSLGSLASLGLANPRMSRMAQNDKTRRRLLRGGFLVGLTRGAASSYWMPTPYANKLTLAGNIHMGLSTVKRFLTISRPSVTMPSNPSLDTARLRAIFDGLSR